MAHPVWHILPLAALLTGVLPAAADDYCARLSEKDHFASDGVRLTTVGAVIRQDRANVHRYGIIDRDDDLDEMFQEADSRPFLQKAVDANRFTPAEKRAILDGTPYVCVSVLGRRVEVDIQR